MDAAKRFSESLVTFDHRTARADFNEILGLSTEGFATQFSSALNGDITAYRKRVEERQATSTGDVHSVSVSSRDQDTATVLVVATQTIRNRERPQPRTQVILLELTLKRTDGTWKVDNVGTPLSEPS